MCCHGTTPKSTPQDQAQVDMCCHGTIATYFGLDGAGTTHFLVDVCRHSTGSTRCGCATRLVRARSVRMVLPRHILTGSGL